MDYWLDEKIDIVEWHERTLCLAPKKGNLSLPDNWRGICLLDVILKLLCSVLCKRLITIMTSLGFSVQFGCTPNVGCQEGTFTLKQLLHTRHHHKLDTWALFMDLIKAFNTPEQKIYGPYLNTMVSPPLLLSCLK